MRISNGENSKLIFPSLGGSKSGVGQKDFDVNEAKKQTPRDVEAVILKNRNGATGDTLHYAYYSMFNKFLDMDDTENYSQQSKPESRTQVDDDGRVFSSNKEYREFLEGQTN